MSLCCDLFRAECHCIWQLLLQQSFLWQLQPLSSALKSPAQWGSGLNNCSPLRTLRSHSLFLQGKKLLLSHESFPELLQNQRVPAWFGLDLKAEGMAQPKPLLWGCSIDGTALEFQSWIFHGIMTCPAQITSQDEGEGIKQGKWGAGLGFLPWAAPSLGVITPTQHLI